MASGTSPSITGLANDRAAVAFHSSIGDELWTWTGYPGTLGMGASTGCAVTCGGLPVVSGTSPSIGAAIPAPEGLSLTARGNVVAKLRAPRTLVLLVYPRTQPAAQRKLLGRVALGQHSAGLSRITWGLRVYGHRLGAGDYVAELDARVHATLTTDGPTVSFDVGRTGKLTVIAQSNPAR